MPVGLKLFIVALCIIVQFAYLSSYTLAFDAALQKRASKADGVSSSSTSNLQRSKSTPNLSGSGQTRQGTHRHIGPTEKNLILVRHGTTYANQEKLVQGHGSTALTRLNPQGNRDADTLGKSLKESGVKVHEIVACHQQRTCQTAAPVAKAYPEASLHTDKRLMGVGMGSAEGKSYAKYGLGRTRSDDWRNRVRGAEPKKAYEKRVNDFHEDVISKPTHQFHGGHTKVQDNRNLPAKLEPGDTHTTVIVGHDWPTREFLNKVGRKDGVTKHTKTDPDSSHGSAGVSMVKVKDIDKMPRRQNGNVDLDRAPGKHFEMHYIAKRPGEKLGPHIDSPPSSPSSKH